MNTKDLEKLEYASNEARIIYHSTPLDSPDIDEAYLAYKNAYNALSYARFFNTDKAYNALSYDRFFNTDKAKQYLESHPGFMSLAGQGVGKSELRKHMANKLKLTQRGNKLNTIEIENLASELIFTHSAEDNTIYETLEKAVIDRTDLTGADLRSACLEGAHLRNARLRNSHLRDIDLGCTDLESADLSGADLEDAFLYNAYLVGAKMSDTNLRHADLGSANLKNADLTNSCLMDTDFTGARLIGTDFRGADLRGANYTKEQILLAIVDETTIF